MACQPHYLSPEQIAAHQTPELLRQRLLTGDSRCTGPEVGGGHMSFPNGRETCHLGAMHIRHTMTLTTHKNSRRTAFPNEFSHRATPDPFRKILQAASPRRESAGWRRTRGARRSGWVCRSMRMEQRESSAAGKGGRAPGTRVHKRTGR